LAGALGSWALAVTTLATTKLDSRDMRMLDIIYRVATSIIPQVRQGYPDWSSAVLLSFHEDLEEGLRQTLGT
jgi:hypothetical protein